MLTDGRLATTWTITWDNHLEEMAMATVSDLERVLVDARAMADSISPDDLGKRTACTEWDVRTLLGHMTGVCESFAAGFQGAPVGGPPPTPDAAPGGDPVAAFGRAADALLRAARAPGALEKTVKLPFGEMPGDRAVAIPVADQMIHTWDLATGLGRPFTMDEALATETLQMMHQLLSPAARGAGQAFGEAVPCPASAPVQDRLLAFSGRRP
jgi:uncharacterized protein (TIGR03086 family)